MRRPELKRSLSRKQIRSNTTDALYGFRYILSLFLAE